MMLGIKPNKPFDSTMVEKLKSIGAEVAPGNWAGAHYVFKGTIDEFAKLWNHRFTIQPETGATFAYLIFIN